MDVHFTASAYPPLALGFFGLGTGYMIYGPQELFHWPKRDELVDKATGIWGIWLPGFCQLVAGVILFVGLSWFQVFTKTAVLYMAALAFSAYGIHWFALGWNRYGRHDARVNAGMCIGYMIISAMGATVFFHAADYPVGVVFVGLFFVYFSDFFASLKLGVGERALGFFHLVTGGWLLYMAYAVTVDFSLGFHWPT